MTAENIFYVAHTLVYQNIYENIIEMDGRRSVCDTHSHGCARVHMNFHKFQSTLTFSLFARSTTPLFLSFSLTLPTDFSGSIHLLSFL